MDEILVLSESEVEATISHCAEECQGAQCDCDCPDGDCCTDY
ncbi:MAG: hypothetical protein UX54_C0010G0011 [Parcubacteria group bacterium GW2011_GWA2_46_39]|nr:MAG: hypothetical protein UX54_C0010G0011 [Parcubacteria group bacterium GW2011_GWA2_46_39]